MINEESGVPIRLIVDIDFKSQFELARPTSTYSQVFNILPSVFVGSEGKLCKIISLLCTAAKQSLKERGLHIPPWRKASYMRSKWLSCCQKVSSFEFPIPAAEGSMVEVAKGGDDESSEASSWTPPKVKPKRRDLGGGAHGSCLSSQFSNMGINCSWTLMICGWLGRKLPYFFFLKRRKNFDSRFWYCYSTFWGIEKLDYK